MSSKERRRTSVCQQCLQGSMRRSMRVQYRCMLTEKSALLLSTGIEVENGA